SRDWSSDVCSSDLPCAAIGAHARFWSATATAWFECRCRVRRSTWTRPRISRRFRTNSTGKRGAERYAPDRLTRPDRHRRRDHLDENAPELNATRRSPLLSSFPYSNTGNYSAPKPVTLVVRRAAANQ